MEDHSRNVHRRRVLLACALGVVSAATICFALFHNSLFEFAAAGGVTPHDLEVTDIDSSPQHAASDRPATPLQVEVAEAPPSSEPPTEAPLSALSESPASAMRAVLHTDHGRMWWALHPEAAPKSVALFVENSRSGVYNGSCIYRYERGFVLQGGLNCAKRPRGAKRSHKTVPLEYSLPNAKMTVALARAGGDLHSGGSEWFVNLRDNSGSLGRKKKGGYAVFASVLDEGGTMDTIAELKKQPTRKKGLTYFVAPQPVVHFIEIIELPSE